MPNYAVSASAKDETVGSGANTGGTLLLALWNNSFATQSYGKALINTSAIGTDVISAAAFKWYHHDYTKTKAASYRRRITIGGTDILVSTATPAAAGWHSEDLTSGELALINKTGETEVLFNVDDPGSTYFRSWNVRSWDYDGAGGFACYLQVTHAPAGGPTRFSILR